MENNDKVRNEEALLSTEHDITLPGGGKQPPPGKGKVHYTPPPTQKEIDQQQARLEEISEAYKDGCGRRTRDVAGIVLVLFAMLLCELVKLAPATPAP